MKVESLAESALRFTEKVTNRWKERLAGSEACRESGNFIREEIATFCDKTLIQHFTMHPGAFLGFIRINVALFIFAVVGFILGQFIVSTVLTLLGIIIIVLEFFYYRAFIDFLYPLKHGNNIIGVLEPGDVVKQQIIVSGHHDSAHVFNFLQHQPKLYGLRIATGLTSIGLLFLVSLTFSILLPLGYELTVIVVFCKWFFVVLGLLVAHLWFSFSKKGTPGAGDNMASTASAIEMGRYFADLKGHHNGLRHTRLLIASWDAEEAGLRGSRAFVNKNRDELKNLPTYNFNIECLYNYKSASFLTSDMNTFVPLSQSMASEGCSIAREHGYDVTSTPMVFLAGATDAAEFAKHGIEATTFIAMNYNDMVEMGAYHTLKDTIDAVDKKAVAMCIDIGINYISHMDRKII